MKKRFISLFPILFLSFYLFCHPDIPQTQDELITYLDELGKDYEEICVEMGIANWNVYSKEAEADQDIPKMKYQELLLKPQHLMIVNLWLGKIDKRKQPKLHRRLEVWKNVLTAVKVDMSKEIFKLENKLEVEITDYKHDIDGELVEHRNLRKVLAERYKKIPERMTKVEECMAEMRKSLEPQVLQLMELRNKKSKEVGFDNYGDLCLHMMGLTPDGTRWFYDMLELIDQKTLKPYKTLLERGKKESGIDELDGETLRKIVYSLTGGQSTRMADIRKDALDVVKETLLDIGFNLDKLPIRIVEKNIPYGGLGLAIKVPTDHRILVLPGRNSVGLFLHEIGHGLHAVHINRSEPIFKNYEWCLGAYSPCYDEGMANVIAGFSRNNQWQIKYNKKTTEELGKEKINQNIVAPYTLRASIADFMFELDLYRNLDEDPEEVTKNLYKKWLLFEPSSNPKKNWATSIFPVAYPCYRQNYFISYMITWHVHEYLKKEFGENYILNKKVSTWLIDNLYSVGHGVHWLERIEKATGKKLDVNEYLLSLGIY